MVLKSGASGEDAAAAIASFEVQSSFSEDGASPDEIRKVKLWDKMGGRKIHGDASQADRTRSADQSRCRVGLSPWLGRANVLGRRSSDARCIAWNDGLRRSAVSWSFAGNGRYAAVLGRSWPAAGLTVSATFRSFKRPGDCGTNDRSQGTADIVGHRRAAHLTPCGPEPWRKADVSSASKSGPRSARRSAGAHSCTEYLKRRERRGVMASIDGRCLRILGAASQEVPRGWWIRQSDQEKGRVQSPLHRRGLDRLTKGRAIAAGGTHE